VKLGDYEVEGEIGRGGMGVVLRARAPDGRTVAIKVLSSTGARHSVERFQRERRLLGSLGEEQGFVPLLDSGDSPRGPFLVMPFVGGGTLRDRIERGPLPEADVLAIGRAVATAMGRAHALGIVHRDLKPENVLFTAQAAPLVADLGLAKHWRDDAPGASQSVSLSKTGETRGTAGYMAPEQMNDAKTVGPPADVFSLGAILYECLTGQAAFVGGSVVETMARATTGSYEPIRTLRPDASAGLVRAIDRALAPAAEARFPDGAALAQGLELGERAVAPRWPLVVVGVAAVIIAGAAAVLAVRPGSTEAPAAARGAPSRSPDEPPAHPPAPEPSSARFLDKVMPRAESGRPARMRATSDPKVFVWQVEMAKAEDRLDIEMVYVTADLDFRMGEGRDDHRHPIKSAYYIGRREITWAQFKTYCRAASLPDPPRPLDGHTGRSHDPEPDGPVVMVSWHEAMAFCSWAGGMSLPSEGEWEHAARGSDGRRYPWGNEPPDPSRAITKDDPTTGGVRPKSGLRLSGASPYGALDMAGNVFEWCLDAWEPDFTRFKRGDLTITEDPAARFHVMRGGSFDTPAKECPVALRFCWTTAFGGWVVGIRPLIHAERVEKR
jgi:serine/threonine-protein kinase